MKVSIIVPVYNVEKFLPRCIQSIKEQTYKNLEVIFVDDGSTDNSGKLCDEYVKTDYKAKVIHKKNGGLSSARNIGIKSATGNAVFFLDSDDYLTVDCIERCVKLLESKKADVAIIQIMYISEQENKELKVKSNENIVILTPQQAIEESLYQIKYTCCAPAKLYKREIISNIHFPEGHLSEDLATCHLFLNNASRVIYSNYYGYFYRQRSGSIMHKFDPKRMDALEWALEIEEFCKVYYPEIINATICRTFNVAIHLLLDMPIDKNSYKDYRDTVWKQIYRTRKTVIFDKKTRNREKIAAFLSLFGDKVLRKVWNSKVAIRKSTD